jgi:hypothetical protein
VAAFYADENFPLPVVLALRRLGHDVVTAFEAGQANLGIPDDAVLEYAAQAERVLLTLNRWDFVALHNRVRDHAGIVVCTQDEDPGRQAAGIDAAVRGCDALPGVLLRVNRAS